jgi:hypothetical protein
MGYGTSVYLGGPAEKKPTKTHFNRRIIFVLYSTGAIKCEKSVKPGELALPGELAFSYNVATDRLVY